LNRITSLTTFKIVISLIYNIIVKNKTKKKSRIISLLKKTNKKIEEEKISINNLKIIILFATLL